MASSGARGVRKVEIAARGARLGPVLKWAGGKRQLLKQILRRLPDKIGTYYEPFVGGGAVFFALSSERRFERAVLADRNRELVEVYTVLRDDVEALIVRLERLPHSESAYYRIRAERPRSMLGRAARIIYLNKTGYNGLYRVNSRGEFNVPFGRYTRPKICDAERLRAAARALSGVELLVEDFETVCLRARKGDAVYLDPPYLPRSRTASFASYHSEPFGLDEHRRLANVFADLGRRRVAALLSNSDTEDTREIFSAFAVDTVSASRPINSNAARRGLVSEILVSPSPLSPRAKSR
jgi:DNA adenine methylase